MNILQPFSERATYAQRRRPTAIILNIVLILCSIISISTAAGYFEVIVNNYIPAAAAVVIAISAATLFDFCKVYFLQVTTFEACKYRYLDLITLVMFAGFFCLSLFASLKGIDAKIAAAELAAIEATQQDSTTTAANFGPAPPAPTMRAKRKYFEALTAFETAVNKRLESQAATAAKIAEHKKQVFKVNKELVLTLEAIVFLIGLSLGYIQSRNEQTETDEERQAREELEIKKLKSKYVADRARAAKGNIKAGQRLEALEKELINLGAEIPETR